MFWYGSPKDKNIITTTNNNHEWHGFIVFFQEIYYYCGKVKSVDHSSTTKDSMKLAANTNPSEQTLQGLTGEGGPLQNGVLPAADASCAEGELALWKALSHEGVSRTKPNKERTPKDAEKMTPKNPKETLSYILHSTPKMFTLRCFVPQDLGISNWDTFKEVLHHWLYLPRWI